MIKMGTVIVMRGPKHPTSSPALQYAHAHKLVFDGLGLSTIDEEDEQLYDNSPFRCYRVPVKRVRQGYVELLACDPKSAESVARVCGMLGDELQDVTESEHAGPAVAVPSTAQVY